METAEAITEYERERGKPMPSANHGAIQISLGAALIPYMEEYSVLSELSLRLDDRPFVPDICVYPRLDLDPLHDEIQKTDPPSMVVEILSPRQLLDDLIQKSDAYLAAGVRSCWIRRLHWGLYSYIAST